MNTHDTLSYFDAGSPCIPYVKPKLSIKQPTSRRRCSQPPLNPSAPAAPAAPSAAAAAAAAAAAPSAAPAAPSAAAAAAAAAAAVCGSAFAGSPACCSTPATPCASAAANHQHPSITAAAAGGRTQSPGGGEPSSTASASINADLPAPLLPLMAVRPGVKCTLLLETSAKSRTDRDCRSVTKRRGRDMRRRRQVLGGSSCWIPG